MSTWNDAWMLLPKNSQSPTEADDSIRSVKTAVERRIRNEHDTTNDATGGAETLDWRHKEGSARCWYESAEPANAPSAGSLEAGHLWWDSDDDQLYCYDGAAFNALHANEADYITDQAEVSDLKVKVFSLDYWGAIATGSEGAEDASYRWRVAHGIASASSKIKGIAFAPYGGNDRWSSGFMYDSTYIYYYSLEDNVTSVTAVVFYTD